MSQISPPLRILLAGSIVFLAAWFVMLRPSAETTPPAPPAAPAAAPGEGLASNPNGPTAKTSVGRAVQQANGASQATEEATKAHGGVVDKAAPAPKTATKPGAATATEPAPAAEEDAAETAGLPTDVAKAIADKKVLVMLFWNPGAADDRMVRRELRGIDRHKGDVKVHVANVEDIARYAPITRGVNVEQSPSVVVVGSDLKADLLTGWADAETIDQYVSDAIRAR